jgi:hypothetical protein
MNKQRFLTGLTDRTGQKWLFVYISTQINTIIAIKVSFYSKFDAQFEPEIGYPKKYLKKPLKEKRQSDRV